MIGWRRRVLLGGGSLLSNLLFVVLLTSLASECPAWAQSQGLTESPSQRRDRSAEQWRAELSGEDLQLRREAAIATRTIDLSLQRELLPLFIAQLGSEEDGQVRLALFSTLTDMGPAASEAVDALAESMRGDRGGRGSEKTHQDYRAALALAAIGPPAVEALQGLLDEEAANLRAEAAMALGRIGPPAGQAAEQLIQLLEDERARVRDEAARSLGRIGAPALDALLRSSFDQNSEARAAVIDATRIDSLGR